MFPSLTHDRAPVTAARGVGPGARPTARRLVPGAALFPPYADADALTATRATSCAPNVAEVRRDLHALAERVARVEGALTGPWRPTNGSPDR